MASVYTTLGDPYTVQKVAGGYHIPTCLLELLRLLGGHPRNVDAQDAHRDVGPQRQAAQG